MAKRGLLIVFEGCDRCGKSTQCRRLLEQFTSRQMPAELWHFPDRTTSIGTLINAYLTKAAELDDKAAHLLFSANRWEKHAEMMAKLNSGVSLIVDRYAFSGVAFTAAKGLPMEWCRTPDQGLPAPDLLLHLELAAGEAEQRGGFGGERYEVSEFQRRVKQQFRDLYASLEAVRPVVLDVSGMSIEGVGAVVDRHVSDAESGPRGPLGTLW